MSRRGVWNSSWPARTRAVAQVMLKETDGQLSFAQLHSLLYLVEGFSLALRGRALVDDTVLAGQSGPEWPALLDETARAAVSSWEEAPTLTDSEEEVVRYVHQNYGDLSAAALRTLTTRQWPVAERAIGEVIVHSEMKVHFQDIVAAQRILRGGRIPELVSFRYRERENSGEGTTSSSSTSPSPRTSQLTLPKVLPDSYDFWGLDEACDRVERYVLLVVRLWHDDSEDFHPIVRQASDRIASLRRDAERVANQEDRRDILRRLGRSRSTVSFLSSYAPGVAGSGVLAPSRPSTPQVSSVTSGGLPGLGNRG